MTAKLMYARFYFLTLFVLLAGGIWWIFTNFYPELLRFIGLLMALLGCAFFNLLYFGPIRHALVRFLLPGILTAFICLFLITGSQVEEKFFTFFGLLNLALGALWLIIHFLKKTKTDTDISR
jgi:hypothetical protein